MTNKEIAISGFMVFVVGLFITCATNLSCSLKDAVKVDANASLLSAEAEKIDQSAVRIENAADKLEQSVVKIEVSKSQEGDNFYYGAGWVVIAIVVMGLIFLTTVCLFIRYFLRSGRNDSMLKLITRVIKDIDPETQKKIKERIEYETSNGGPFGIRHKEMLATFTKANGTFVEKK